MCGAAPAAAYLGHKAVATSDVGVEGDLKKTKTNPSKPIDNFFFPKEMYINLISLCLDASMTHSLTL